MDNNDKVVTWEMANRNEDTRVLAVLYLTMKGQNEALSPEENKILNALRSDNNIRKKAFGMLEDIDS